MIHPLLRAMSAALISMIIGNCIRSYEQVFTIALVKVLPDALSRLHDAAAQLMS